MITSLKLAVQRMPQLLNQLSTWLGTEHAAGKVAHHSGQGQAGR